MPKELDEKKPIIKIATEPLTPISAIVIVGVIVIKKKTNITAKTASKKLTSTPKTSNNKINCNEKIKYLTIEKINVINKSLNEYMDNTSIYD